MNWRARAEQLKTDVPALVVLTLKCIPREILAGCRVEAAGMWAEGKPKKRYCALPILALWGLAAVLLVRLLLRLR